MYINNTSYKHWQSVHASRLALSVLDTNLQCYDSSREPAPATLASTIIIGGVVVYSSEKMNYFYHGIKFQNMPSFTVSFWAPKFIKMPNI